MVKAYAAGLGHHPPSTKRLLGTPFTPEKNIVGGSKGEGGEATTSTVSGGAAAAKDLWSDGGGDVASSNRWAMGPVARKALFLSLQAGAVACLLYTSPSPRDLSTSRMPSSA